MDELNIDFDIHTRCQIPHDFMSTCDFNGNNVVYKFALDRFTKLNKLMMYLASKYSLKSNVLVDATELIYQLWTEVYSILYQKAQRAEVINECIFNVNCRQQLVKLKYEIQKTQNFDFQHDLELTHCMKHLEGQAKLLESQNELLLTLRDDSMRLLGRFNGNTGQLGPDMTVSASFQLSKRQYKLCEINPYCSHIFTVIDEANSSIMTALDASDRESVAFVIMKSLNVFNKVEQKFKLGLASYMDLYGPAVKQNFFSFESTNAKLSRDLLKDAESRYTLDELITYYHLLMTVSTFNKQLVGTAVVLKEYEKLCQKFKFNQANMYLRPVLPKAGKSGEKPKPRCVPPDDRMVDRFKPTFHSIAVNDYDEDILKHVSFQTSSKIDALVKSKSGVRKVHIACRIQLLHRQLLLVLIKLGRMADLWPLEHNVEPDDDEKQSKNDEAQTIASSAITDRPKHAAAELFCSYQFERLAPRAKYLDYFTSGVNVVGDVEKFRVEALEQLADQIKRVVDELAHRCEIIESYAKILFFTKSFPAVVKQHFSLGISLRYEPEQVDLLHQGVISNMFNIPHFSSVMVAGRKLTPNELNDALKVWSLAAKSLADLIGFYISKSQLGVFCCNDRGSWGGIESIHESVLDLRREMDKCGDMGSVCRYLILSRQQMLLEVDLAFLRVRTRLINQKQYTIAANIYDSYQRAFAYLQQMSNPDSLSKVWTYIDKLLKSCLAPLSKNSFSFVNSELLSVAVLVEEVLIECEDTIGMRRQAADRGARKFLKLIGRNSKQPSSKPNVTMILSKMTSSNFLANSPVGAKLKIFTPVEAAEFAVSYIHLHLQLVPLRERWGKRRFKVRNLYKDEVILNDYQDAYRLEVLYSVVKSISINLKYELRQSSTGLDEDCQVYKLLPKVSRLEIMACEVSRLCEIEFLDAIQLERQSLNRLKNARNESRTLIKIMANDDDEHDNKARFGWLSDKLSQHNMEQNAIIETMTMLEKQWEREENNRRQTFNLVVKEMKKPVEVNTQPKTGLTHLADINKDLLIQIKKLQADNIKLQSENRAIKDECKSEAIEHYRPLVTTQYAELMKMAAKFNIYQYDINKRLQSTIQRIREDAFGKLTKGTSTTSTTSSSSSTSRSRLNRDKINDIKNNNGHWHVIQRMLLRLRLASTISSSEREIKKSNEAAQGWKFRYFELKNIADKMIEQFDHESSVQKVRQLDTIKLILKKDVIEQLMSETPKTPKNTSQRKTASQHHHSSEDNKKEHEMMEQLSMNRIKQVDNVRQAALIETKMRLAEREKDLAEINATMLDQQRQFDSQLRKQAHQVQEAASKLTRERTKKLAAYDDVEKLQVQLDESRRVQSSLGNYSPRSTSQFNLASRPKSAVHHPDSSTQHSSLSPLLRKRQTIRQNSIF